MGILKHSSLEELYNQVRRACALLQPDLACSLSEGRVIIEGTFHVPSSDPQQAALGPIASYGIRLELYEGHPQIEPKLFETEGAFPHDSDHHVNYDGSCCFGVWQVLLAEHPKMTVAGLLDGPIRSYFFGQHHLKYEGSWPFGELKHGVDGLIQAYAKFLGCPEDPNIVRSLLVLLGRKWKRDRHLCPCGSGSRVRDCCRAHLEAIPTKIHYKNVRPLKERFQLYHT